jgi:hypothetical protein
MNVRAFVDELLSLEVPSAMDWHNKLAVLFDHCLALRSDDHDGREPEELEPNDRGPVWSGELGPYDHDTVGPAEPRRNDRYTVERDGLGPNGHRIGYTSNGDKVEWVPDDDNPDMEAPILLRRNDTAIKQAYDEFWDKVWWNRHQILLKCIESGELPPEQLLPQAVEAAARIEAQYGRDNLGWDKFELGMLSGRMSALAWVLGARWNDSLDM